MTRLLPRFLLAVIFAASLAVSPLSPARADALDDQLAAGLHVIGYTNILHVALDNTDWWAEWLRKDSPGYPDFQTAAALPGAKCVFLFKIEGNEWWHKMKYFYDATEDDTWLEEESGTVTVGNGKIYNLDGTEHSGNWFDLTKYHFMVCNLPDFTDHYSILGMFWQKADLQMYVAIPDGQVIYGIKFTEKPTTLALGESAPAVAVVYDQVSGTEYPEIAVQYTSPNNNLSHAAGQVRARATGNGTLTAAATTTNGEVKVSASITVPMVNQRHYELFDTWTIDRTIDHDWWLPIPALGVRYRQGVQKENVLFRIDYGNQSGDTIGTGGTFVLDNDWIEVMGWHYLAPNTEESVVFALADAHPGTGQIVFNMATGLYIKSLTIYHKVDATFLLLR